jgi:REP element-mobilizing transposase RayT
MDRYWFLTWRTYGTRLPGDEKGSIARVRNNTATRTRNNTPGKLMDGAMPGLERASRELMTGDPIFLSLDQANAVLAQLLETATFRKWHVLAAAVVANHVHIVFGVMGDPDPEGLLGDYKAYGTRTLNRGWGRRPNGTWWADKGSKRKLANEESVKGAVIYVATQEGALAIYIAPEWSEVVERAKIQIELLRRSEPDGQT